MKLTFKCKRAERHIVRVPDLKVEGQFNDVKRERLVFEQVGGDGTLSFTVEEADRGKHEDGALYTVEIAPAP